jgi:hypothetical protein
MRVVVFDAKTFWLTKGELATYELMAELVHAQISF